MRKLIDIPQLPDSFKDFACEKVGGRGPTGAFMSHCRREAFHAQLAILFDDEFMEAYKHGIVIKCCDGITRRFYPRMFTYSADYPEKSVTPFYLICPSVLIYTKDLSGIHPQNGRLPLPKVPRSKGKLEGHGN